MGIRFDYSLARDRLVQALNLAQSDASAPGEWTERTERVAAFRAKTFIVALGTALLARATDDRVDALTLKARAGNRAYSARTLAHNVLVPAAVEFGFDLRATSREPLNNQPFFRYERVDRMERVKYPAEIDYLVQCLERVNDLRDGEALEALSAFLRDRLLAAARVQRIDLRRTAADLLRIRSSARQLLAKSEGGKRSQALVAAAFDLVYDDVRTSRVNDPSRRLPGDVQAFHREAPVVTAEVRSKLVRASDVAHFVRSAVAGRFPCAVIAALDGIDFDGTAAALRVWEDHGLLLTVHSDFGELLLQALAWSRKPLHESLRAFPKLALSRLQQLEVEVATLEEWRDLVSD